VVVNRENRRITAEGLLPPPSSKNPACPFQSTGLKPFTTPIGGGC